MAGLKFDKITRYKISAKCEGPLHIGSAIGDRAEVLIDPISDTPFVQASSIAGVFRAYCRDILKDSRWVQLFGSNAVENMSRLRFEDGHFNDGCKMEYRPHVRINRKTGSVQSEIIKGDSRKSGQKYNMEYVGTGSEICFDMYLFEDTYGDDDLSGLTMELISAMKCGLLQFGGKKSNGTGIVRLLSVKLKKYNMTDEADRKAWRGLEDSDLQDYTNKLDTVENGSYAYEIIVNGCTENNIQVKGLATLGTGKGAPDSQNIRNAIKEYIIPGSSFKGAVRAHMEKIASYLECDEVIELSFGKKTESGNLGCLGNLIFSDTVIGNIEENDNMNIQYRIHIDKFTGSVFNKGLFNEKNASGELSFKIKILDRNNPKKTLGLLMFALRDLAIGTMSVGNGYSIGKGIINVSEIHIMDKKNNCEATIDYSGEVASLVDDNDIISQAICELRRDIDNE